jgi:hypothetical protein
VNHSALRPIVFVRVFPLHETKETQKREGDFSQRMWAWELLQGGLIEVHEEGET